MDFGDDLLSNYITSFVDSKTFKVITNIYVEYRFFRNSEHQFQQRAFIHETQHLFGSIEPHAFLNGQKVEEFLHAVR